MGSKKCIFVGGAYGVGKSSICASYAADAKVGHYTASDLIKKVRDADSKLYKEVIDPQKNQDALLLALRNHVTHDRFLLDGHFVIKTAGGHLTRIPLDTYQSIAPTAIIVITGEPHEASTRLQLRDKKTWSPAELKEIQEAEIEHGRKIADTLKIDIHIIPAASPNLFALKAAYIWGNTP